MDHPYRPWVYVAAFVCTLGAIAFMLFAYHLNVERWLANTYPAERGTPYGYWHFLIEGLPEVFWSLLP